MNEKARFLVTQDSNATKTPKRIAVLRRDVPARRLTDDSNVVTTAPHLLLREIVLFQLCMILLAVISLAIDAPLEGLANPLVTPNPAKASWYFLGLQELLHYFPPVVAGVLLPGLVVIALVLIPYVRVNWELVGFYEQPWKRRLLWLSGGTALISLVLTWHEAWPVLITTWLLYGAFLLPAFPFCPERLRKRLGRIPLADWIMTWFVALAVVLTLIGILFRGPGWSWTWPWIDGIYQ